MKLRQAKKILRNSRWWRQDAAQRCMVPVHPYKHDTIIAAVNRYYQAFRTRWGIKQ